MTIPDLNEKELGVVLTPPKTADYIVSKLGISKKNLKVLDPCVGPGIFVKSLLKSGFDKSQIFCHDINADYKSNIEDLGVNFKVIDNLIKISLYILVVLLSSSFSSPNTRSVFIHRRFVS